MPAIGDHAVKPLVLLVHRIAHALVHRHDQAVAFARLKGRRKVQRLRQRTFGVDGDAQFGLAAERQRRAHLARRIRIEQGQRDAVQRHRRLGFQNHPAQREQIPMPNSPCACVGDLQQARLEVPAQGKALACDFESLRQTGASPIQNRPRPRHRVAVCPHVNGRLTDEPRLDARHTPRHDETRFQRRPVARRLGRRAAI